ncbi:MAG: AAA family ATPase [Actinomycetota bacterium]
MILFCPTCGHANREGAAYCSSCGSSLMRCPRCGAPTDVGDRFCSECGAPLQADDTIRSSASERKRVTILFADIVGSTSLIGAIDPEEAADLVTPAVEAMMGAVARYQGTVTDVLGDGIMAVFGAPLAYEDHAVRACLAALEIPALVSAVSNGRIEMRVGLNTGEAFIRDGKPLGLAVHVAARMQQLAGPGQILLTDSTRRLADGYVKVTPLGPRELRGVIEPIDVYVLEGATTTHRWDVRVGRPLATFVGREVEMAHLRRAAARAQAGAGQVAAVMAGPGMGKSRLVHELLNFLPPDTRILEAEASPYDETVAYAPFRDLIERWFEDPGADDRITEELATTAENPAVVIPALRALLGFESKEWSELAPDVRRRRTRQAIVGLLLGAAGRGLVVLLVEDLHWADTETLAVLDDLLKSFRESSLLLVITYRPEFDDPWTGLPNHTRISLEGLEPDQAAALVDDLVGADQSVGELKASILARTGGVPLFVEETVRGLADTGVLQGEPGAYRTTTSELVIDMPETVDSVITARIDRLEPQTKRVLQTAAVLGIEFSRPILAQMLAEPEEALKEQLDELRRADFVYETRKLPIPEFRMKHALIRDAAYGSLPLRDRRMLHRAAVRALKEGVKGQPERLELLAQHAAAGAEWESGVRFARSAGEKALDRSAYREAARLFELAIECLDHLPETEENLRAGVEVRTQLRPAYGARGSFWRAARHLEDAERLARRLPGHRALADVKTHQAYHFSMVGRRAESLAAAEEAIGLLAGDDRLALAEARLANSQMYVFSGPPRAVIELLTPDVEYWVENARFDRHGQTGIRSVYALAHLGSAYAALGDFDRAASYTGRAYQIAAESQRPFDLTYALYCRGLVDHLRGESDAAITFLAEALREAIEHDIALHQAWVRPVLAEALANQGRTEEGAGIIEHYPAWEEHPLFAAWAAIARAELALATGDQDRARADAAAALTLSERQGYVTQRVQALRLLAAAGAEDAAGWRDRAWALATQHELVVEQDRLSKLLTSKATG